jgi:hypothetical protein
MHGLTILGEFLDLYFPDDPNKCKKSAEVKSTNCAVRKPGDRVYFLQSGLSPKVPGPGGRACLRVAASATFAGTAKVPFQDIMKFADQHQCSLNSIENLYGGKHKHLYLWRFADVTAIPGPGVQYVESKPADRVLAFDVIDLSTYTPMQLFKCTVRRTAFTTAIWQTSRDVIRVRGSWSPEVAHGALHHSAPCTFGVLMDSSTAPGSRFILVAKFELY